MLNLDTCFRRCTAAVVVPKLYCLTEKTGLQDSLSVKHNTERRESVTRNNSMDADHAEQQLYEVFVFNRTTCIWAFFLS